MTFDFSDEDGFISIVNTDKYKGFVDFEWQLDQLLQHFVNQMNDRNLIIWTSNEDGGNEWTIEILKKPSDRSEFRHFNFPILVTNNSLYLVPYNDLTMAAQFEDEVIPSKHNSFLKMDILNALYAVTVRQMFNPKDFDYEVSMTHFEIIFSTNKTTEEKTDKVFWWT